MSEDPPAYGTTRERGPTVSYGEIERAARSQMAAGERPTVGGVHKLLGRGSPNHIAAAMQRFWKDQAALNGGDPVALTRVPPELAEATQDLWERALRLSLQTAQHEDNEARERLAQLKRDTDARIRSVELREKEWDMAARVRERALTETREQVNVLLKELASATAKSRAHEAQIADLQLQIEGYRSQLATVIARAVTRSRTLKPKKRAARGRKPPPKSKQKKRVVSKQGRRRPKR